jgi:hypothetical protein
MSNDDELIASELRRTEVPPLGLTARLEAGVLRREREEGRLTLTETVCVVAVSGLVGVGGGPIATLLALLVGVAYSRWTILVEA